MFATDSAEAPVERPRRGRSTACDQVENPKVEQWPSQCKGRTNVGLSGAVGDRADPAGMAFAAIFIVWTSVAARGASALR